MIVYDKRAMGKGRSDANRKRFLDRYKDQIKHSVDEAMKGKSIKDITKGGTVKINKKHISEPNFEYDRKTGNKNIVLPGNKKFNIGDTLPKPEEESGRGRSGSDNPDPFEDDFVFTLTKEEFIEVYFQNMELPKFIKENIKRAVKYKYQYAGTTKYGNPSRIHLRKTFEQALARRIATKSKKPYLDEMDIRYRQIVAHPKPVMSAVMFCCMDVSGSMGSFEKELAKKFYILLYLFLFKSYKSVEVRFIRHTTEAKEVDEHEFFYSHESGGTIVSSALRLIADIIKKEYDTNTTNIYIAQASDGDNFDSDNNELVIPIMENELLPIVQYFTYIQVETPEMLTTKEAYNVEDLFVLYSNLGQRHKNLNSKHVNCDSDVFKSLQELFKKEA